MPANKKEHTINILWYLLSDYLTALVASMIFHFSRRLLLSEPILVNNKLFLTNRFCLGTITIHLCWLILYAIIGSYTSLYKKSRLNELTKPFIHRITRCT